jgi:hypothetical protein
MCVKLGVSPSLSLKGKKMESEDVREQTVQRNTWGKTVYYA